MKTEIIFRKWKTGDVIALFPGIASDAIDGYYCLSYQRVGQHGGASPAIVADTKPAKRAEYKDLAQELTQVGYDLKVIKRFRAHHRKIRDGQIKK
jgi:hypothetical protein